MPKSRLGIATLAVLASYLIVLRPVFSEEKPVNLPSPAALTLQDLKAAKAQFMKGNFAARRKELVAHQDPKVIVLSCSDSRVPPEHIFGKGLGDLFTVRVAGNILGAATVASLEYAAEHLGASLLVVMGHESCGAVKAALTTERGDSAGSLDLDSLVSSIQGNLDRAAELPGRGMASVYHAEDKKLRQAVIGNVDVVAADLMKRSKIIRHRVETGKLKIVRAIYSLESGKVDFWGE